MSKIAKPMLDSEYPLPNCRACAHYFITWDVKFPHGCRAMNFKSKNSPHADVLESSGKPCLMFLLRQPQH